MKDEIYSISNSPAKARYLVNLDLIIENSCLTPIGDSEIGTNLASTLSDLGLHSKLSNSRLIDYQSAAENLRNFLVANMPANGKRLSIPITKFAYNGGKLSLLLHPRTPKPIALIASMLLFPDLIVEEFAISSAHHP